MIRLTRSFQGTRPAPRGYPYGVGSTPNPVACGEHYAQTPAIPLAMYSHDSGECGALDEKETSRPDRGGSVQIASRSNRPAIFSGPFTGNLNA